MYKQGVRQKSHTGIRRTPSFIIYSDVYWVYPYFTTFEAIIKLNDYAI